MESYHNPFFINFLLTTETKHIIYYYNKAALPWSRFVFLFFFSLQKNIKIATYSVHATI